MPTLTYSIFFRCVKKNLSYTNKNHQLCLCALVYNPPPELQVVPGVKNPSADAGGTRYTGLIPGQGRSPWRRKWQPTTVFLPGRSHGQRSLVGYSLWGCEESDTIERLAFSHASQYLLIPPTFHSKNVPTWIINCIWSPKF